MAILQDPAVLALIDQVRDEFGLETPLDRADVRANRRKDRTAISQRLTTLAAQHDWPISSWETAILRYSFRLADLRQEALDFFLADTADHPPTPKERRNLEITIDAVVTLLDRSGVNRLIAETLINLFTDYAIEGDLRPPRALPPWFVGSVFPLPFLGGDRVILALLSRFSDPDEISERIRAEYEAVFPESHRPKRSRNTQRDTWLTAQYVEIKESLEADRAELHALDELLDRNDTRDLHATVFDQLLDRFSQSPWSHHLDRYNLQTASGRRAAKNFLKQIVHRERARYRRMLKTLEPAAPEAVTKTPAGP